MSEFKALSTAVNTAFNSMVAADAGSKTKLFVVDASGDELWAAYLAAFPEGSNPMFRERTEHDCSTCRQFIKNIGGVVMLDAGKLTTVWDAVVNDDVYAVVASRMAAFVLSKPIKAPFFVTEPQYGCAKTVSGDEVWNHFEAVVPRAYIMKHNPSSVVGERRTDFEVFVRSMETITDEAIEVVSDLIASNSIYLGTTFKEPVAQLKRLKAQYNAAVDKVTFAWSVAKPATRFRNTVIGTLLVDISDGVSLEEAVGKFEAKTAPTNYKRTTALVTDRMIADAKKTVEKLGIEDAFHRRYATRGDVSVNNVLFVDGAVRPVMIGGVFDTVKATKKTKAPDFDKADSIGIADFLTKVLPTATELELFVENKHVNNFVSLIAPQYPDAPPLFKWDNGFSWSYDGEVTDSIKERVKRAGGKVDGDVRVSLSWHNGDDLDLAVGNGRSTLYFGNKRVFGATLDVDMNAGYSNNSVDPVENIVWPRIADIVPGKYSILVNNFNQRSTANQGFEVEVEIMGRVFSYSQPSLANKKTVEIGSIEVDKAGNITVKGLTEGSSSAEKWGVATQTWVPVDVVMKSPNYWDGQAVGNEHVFFMLKGCANPDSTRGFYNEFLRGDLTAHRKVFEVLGSSLKAPYNDNQLSGIGVSTTKKEELSVRVKGNVNRVLKIVF